jgi:hypothetical protein
MALRFGLAQSKRDFAHSALHYQASTLGNFLLTIASLDMIIKNEGLTPAVIPPGAKNPRRSEIPNCWTGGFHLESVD